MAFEDKYLWYKIRINVLLISNNFLDLFIFLNLLLFSILDCYFSLFFNIKVTPAISESAIQQMQSVFCDIIDDWYVNNRTKIYVCVCFFLSYERHWSLLLKRNVISLEFDTVKVILRLKWELFS